MNIDELEIEVRKLVPEDGDVLVLKSSRPLRREVRMHLAEMANHLGRRLQKHIDCIILDDGLDLEVLKTSRLADLRPSGQVAA
ncbi:hypothetical protein N8A98_06695 [Devosia neptuniae]|uniref:Uncharacterized protein n=1 Tax=Devosia neptuniae TaxID=191302 RepID=A0ABY6CF49_9HYPH|nr:hypothetical protein [Devosia neptuniae]UXN70869.1 hypothetical protein N8A98_06695 [Devosia neptuniae]